MVETGSLRRAAARLGLAQPALSRQMQTLEHELRIGVIDEPPPTSWVKKPILGAWLPPSATAPFGVNNVPKPECLSP